MYQGKLATASNIAWHRPMAETFRHEEELMQKSERELTSATDPLEKLRLLCFSRGAAGILGFSRIFRAMDKDGSRRLSQHQFFNGIKETGLQLNHKDAMKLFETYDTDKSGFINLDEFLAHICPPVSDSRRAIVEHAFRKLDKTGHGVITVADIRAVYDVTAHPRYMSGEETADVILNEFLANFKSDEQVDGKVTLEEFMSYYCSISVAIDNDCFFDLMMRQAYNL